MWNERAGEYAAEPTMHACIYMAACSASCWELCDFKAS